LEKERGKEFIIHTSKIEGVAKLINIQK